ncbi:MAG: GNAT family N-acetyltransferase [Hyphomonadaceae bacterium]|nr:GNAT family N-acetyltransferase [Hyphomonadaceae bacterium]
MTAAPEPTRTIWEKIDAFLFEHAPDIAAAFAFTAGAILVVTLAAPNLPQTAPLERFAEEYPEWGASVGGVLLMALATGLRARLDAAWAATVVLMAAAALYALLRHDEPLGSEASIAAIIVLLLTRRAFYRRSHLTQLAPGPRVAWASAIALAAALIGGLLWAGARPGFAEAPWWALLLDPELGRPGRGIAFAGAALAALVLWRFVLTRPRADPAPPADEDLARVESLVARAENSRPEAQLAFLGDKSFLFGGEAFMMVARSGASLVAMGAPIGARASWGAALSALRARAEELALRPVVYAAPPELLPDLLECGFRVEKIGENAIVQLTDFKLSGSAKQDLRTARRKFAERAQGSFDIVEPPAAPALLGELAAISEAWLAAHGGREKSFSLGRFDPGFIARHHLAVARVQGAPIAFANIWTTPDRVHAALDLMRFNPANAPPGTMDFLFTEMLLWAQSAGFRDFDLGMAPLAGLAENEYAPLFARFGRFIFERAESFYGFQGLRKFKEKFGPSWEPRYLAATGAWQMPVVLAEVALLTNGGVASLLPRVKA